MERIYFDCAASTPVDSEVQKAMSPYFSRPSAGRFGNPNSLHFFGQQARKAVDESREKIAETIGGDFREIIFNGSATEANNLAIRGIVKTFKNKTPRPRIIVSAVEHESVLSTARDLEDDGIEVIYLPVNKYGIVDLKKLKENLNENTILVSIMYANNETGVVQPISKVFEIIQEFRVKNLVRQSADSKNSKKNSKSYIINPISRPLFHTDAVQAFQFLNCNPQELGVDMMTLSAHKIYGPKGIGLLHVKSLNPISCILNPVITGGGQEFGLRSGTENVPYIVGFAKAVELVQKNREKEFKRIHQLSGYFWKNLKKIYPAAQINGFNPFLNPVRRGELNAVPNILNIYFPDFEANNLLIKLDLNGIAVSSGSACAAFSAKKSHVFQAMGLSEKRICSSLRFSFGKFTTGEEIKKSLKIISKILKNNDRI